MVCLVQPRLARNRLRSGTRSDPCISSITTPIMITSSDCPMRGAGWFLVQEILPEQMKMVVESCRLEITQKSEDDSLFEKEIS
jgi:hypothetical protein